MARDTQSQRDVWDKRRQPSDPENLPSLYFCGKNERLGGTGHLTVDESVQAGPPLHLCVTDQTPASTYSDLDPQFASDSLLTLGGIPPHHRLWRFAVTYSTTAHASFPCAEFPSHQYARHVELWTVKVVGDEEMWSHLMIDRGSASLIHSR